MHVHGVLQLPQDESHVLGVGFGFSQSTLNLHEVVFQVLSLLLGHVQHMSQLIYHEAARREKDSELDKHLTARCQRLLLRQLGGAQVP